MNRKNLNKMAEFIATVPQNKFDMVRYRNYGLGNHIVHEPEETYNECNTVGCIIGHCTILDTKPLPITCGLIDFARWSENFTKIDRHSDEWAYLFGSEWELVDNTPTGASKRILHFLENGLPQNHMAIMRRLDPLPY